MFLTVHSDHSKASVMNYSTQAFNYNFREFAHALMVPRREKSFIVFSMTIIGNLMPKTFNLTFDCHTFLKIATSEFRSIVSLA